MIPNVAAQRVALRDVLVALPDPVTVFEAAPHSSLPSRFLLLSMPEWRPATDAVGWDRTSWAVMVCVARTGTNDTATAQALEALWPRVLGHLDEAIDQDPTLGGVCYHATITRAEFDVAALQGVDYPAQIITIEMQGA